VTVTPLADAFVVQTQITKWATCPGLTCDELENDWTRTQSCGFLAGAGDLLGVGVGVGDAELGVGVGVAVGVVEALGLELALFGDDDFGVGLESLAVGVGVVVVGLVLGEELELADELGLVIVLLVVLGVALALVLLDGVALALLVLVLALALVEPALALALLLADFVLGEELGGLPGHCVTCVGAPDAGATTASRAEVFGTEEHAVLTMGGFPAAPMSAASAPLSTAVERNANPETATITVGLITTCALTCETSLQRSTPPGHPDAPCCSHYATHARTHPASVISGIGFN
jgi:hypothetical protein